MTSCEFIHAQARKITSTVAWLTALVRYIPISDKLKCWGSGGQRKVHSKTSKMRFFKTVMFNRFTQVQEQKPKSQGLGI